MVHPQGRLCNPTHSRVSYSVRIPTRKRSTPWIQHDCHEGKYEKSVEALEDAVEQNEENYLPRLWLAASYVQLGRQDDAEWEITQIDTLVPGFSLSNLNRFPRMRGRLLDDLRTAGMPD